MATTVRYRRRGGEVVKISTKGQTFDDINQTYEGVLTDPVFDDGAGSVLDPAGQPRMLGYAQVWTGTSCRLATQQEIDQFQADQDEDEKDISAADAVSVVDTHPVLRRALKSVIDRVVQENNIQAAKINAVVDQWNTFKADVALSVSLANLKGRVALLPSIAADVPTRTKQQAIDAVKADISRDD